MSRTQIKNGSQVQRAIHHLSVEKATRGHRFVTVGEVALEAGCSRPTALKYLKVLMEYGICRGEQLYNGQWFWVWGK